MDNERNKLVRIKISDIEYNKSKLKENDFQLFEKLKFSIQSQGQLKSITVCELENGKYECIEGSKILKSLIELNYDEVICINIGKVTQIEKDIIRLQLFKDYFMVDYSAVGVMLKEILKEMQVINLCNTIPFDKRQVENLVDLTKFDWEAFNMNKQIEGQMSLFGIVQQDEIIEEVEDEELLRQTYPANVEGSNEFNEIAKQEIIEQVEIEQPIVEIQEPIIEIKEQPKEIVIEKSMSSLFDSPIETKIIEKPIEPIIKEELKSNIEVSHEYAHIVYEHEGEYKMMPERQYFDIGKKYEQIHRNTFSNCRLFIIEMNQKNK